MSPDFKLVWPISQGAIHAGPAGRCMEEINSGRRALVYYDYYQFDSRSGVEEM